MKDELKAFIVYFYYACRVTENKINPRFDYHRILLQEFLTPVWAFYDRLNDFRKNPDENEKEILENEFDMLFSTETGYAELDKRIVLPKLN